VIEPPGGRRYDFWAGELDDLDPAPSPLDDTFLRMMTDYTMAGGEERAEFMAALDSDDSYALLNFSGRAALLGLRSGAPKMVRAGLAAEFVIDPHVIDYRDAGWFLPRLHYVMARLGMHPADEYEAVVRLACPAMTHSLRHQFARLIGHRTLEEFRRHDFLSVEVMGPTGIGFIKLGIEPFRPRADLLGALLATAALIRAEPAYQRDRIEAGESFEWFEALDERRPQIGELPGRINGVAKVSATLRPGTLDASSGIVAGYALWITLIETADAQDAAHIAKSAAVARFPHFAHAAVAADKLVAVVQSRRANEASPPFEDETTLQRFHDPLNHILRETRLLPGTDPFELSGVPVPGGLFQ
jgi:hypothetical protein